MSKARRTVLIVATVLLVTGAAIAMGAFAAAGFNLANLSTVNGWERTTDTFAPEAETPHTSLVVNSGGYGVRIERGESDSFEVVSWSNSEMGVEVSDENGTLTVRSYRKNTFSFMQLDLDRRDRATVVKVPASYTGSIAIESGSGSVSVYNLEGLSSFSIDMSSGYAVVTHVTAEEASLRMTSGNMDVSHLQANNVSTFTMSGSINLSSVTATQAIKTETGSGNHHLSALSAPEVIVRTMSGYIDASSIDATDISFDITSGNVNASLTGSASDYIIDTSVTSGNLSIPKGSSDGGRYLSVHMGSGSADITFDKSPGAPAQSIPSFPKTPTPPAAPAAPSAPAAPEAPAMP